ncbi:MAG TPA: hypothetical protein PLM10_02050 [Saccharofermentans sp.]|nr:hypothetical protein [Saccharofermentans sp.]
MSEAEDLTHFGVKGMRWGVRKASSNTSSKMSKKTDPLRGDLMTKADVKWQKKSKNLRKGIAAYNQAADAMNNTHIPRLNNKPEYKGVNLFKNPKVMAKYNAEYSKVFDSEFSKALNNVYGSSPSGKYKVVSDGTNNLGWKLAYNEDKVKHSDDTEFTIDIDLRRDNFGHILEFKIKDSALIQSDINSYLEHFGVKGMRWGVRKSTSGSSTTSKEPTPVSVITKAGSSKIATKGGTNLPADSDAKIAAGARQKLKKSGVNSLSNKEMQVLVNRMNLERQLTSLTPPDTKTRLKSNATKIVSQAAKQGLQQAANQAASTLIKTAIENMKKK